MKERVRQEGLNTPNLLYCDRIAATVNALIKMGSEKEGELLVRKRKRKIKDGDRLVQQLSTKVIIAPSEGVKFTRAAIFVRTPSKNSIFMIEEKRIADGCLLQGIDEKGKVVSVGFTTHVLGRSKYAETIYTVQREGRKPVQWAEGTPNPLAISEQQRIAKAVRLPTF